MYTRQQGEGTGKILLQPNQAPRTDKNASSKNNDKQEKPPAEQAQSAQTEEKSTDQGAKETQSEDGIKIKKRNVSHYKARRHERKDTENAPEGNTEKVTENKSIHDTDTPDHRTLSHENGAFTPKPSPPSPPPEPPCTPQYITPRKSGLSALLDSYTTDELLILAIIILLIMQGSDDILVLALCYVIL